MPQYNLTFAEKLVEAADFVLDDAEASVEAQRTALYLSLLSIELALKCLLEHAGIPTQKIRSRSHNLAKLLEDIDHCYVIDDIGGGNLVQVSASRIRGVVVDPVFSNATLGAIIDSTQSTASNYPNEIRYGTNVTHYPAPLMAKAAHTAIDWIKNHCATITKVRS